MGAIKRFIKAMEESRIKQVVFFCVSMVVIFTLYFPVLYGVRLLSEKTRISDLTLKHDFKTLFHMESMEEKGEICLTGWLMKPYTNDVEVKVVLVGEKEKDIEVISTTCFENEKVAVLDENEGECYGFFANIEKNKLKADVCYRVQFVLDYIPIDAKNDIKSREKILSGKYLFNGEIYNYNPKKYEEPQVTDEALADVVEVENLKYFDFEQGCWVYAYDNHLYLIINEKFDLKNDGMHRIKFHIHTEQTDLLPTNRKQYGYESKDFFFDEKEYFRSGDSSIRVAVLDLPKDYVISWVELGKYEVGGNLLVDMPFLFFEEME